MTAAVFAPPFDGPLWLASRSPRRARLLAECAVEIRVHPAAIDDGNLVPGAVGPAAWVTALAYLKARWVADDLEAIDPGGAGVVLGADTLCVHEGRLLGQPPSADAARAMIESLRDAAHVTMTGVCAIDRRTRERWMLVDAATVTMGALDDATIDAYLASNEWRGKAGAYNYADRRAAGWPIACAGDAATVMGLPMQRLEPWLAGRRTAP